MKERLDERFLEYLAGARRVYILAARKQKPDYSISNYIETQEKEEKSKPERIRFLEKRFSRINNAAQLLANKIKNGYLDEASSEELNRRGKRACKNFERTYDLNEEYMSYFLGANLNYCSYVRIGSDNISKLRGEVETRMEMDKFLDRLQGEEFE